MTMPIDLVLVRHGESEGNVALKLSKGGDHSYYTEEFRQRHASHYRLTAAGRDQAAKAGALLRLQFPDGFGRYYVSDYVRANETAGLLGLPDADWRNSIYLREREWGDLDNLTIEERDERYAEVVERRKRHPFYWVPPNGESLAHLTMRIDRFLDTLHRETSKQQVIVVCHGEVMWVFRVLVERLTPYLWQKLDDAESIKNCQIIHYTRVDPDTGFRAEAVNWRRSAVPSGVTSFSGWSTIKRRTFSNEQLLSYAQKYPPLFESEAGSV